MTQFLDIFGFLSVLLRGLALAFEALAVGGVIFQLWIARDFATRKAWNWVALAATLLVITQLDIVAADSAILLSTTDLSPANIAGADFVTASILMIGGAIAVIILSQKSESELFGAHFRRVAGKDDGAPSVPMMLLALGRCSENYVFR
jgi:putative copper resistance protein D